MIGRLQPIVPFTLDSDGIADNLCKVEVFYEQFDYESIEESEAYPVIRRITRVISFVMYVCAKVTTGHVVCRIC